MGDGDEARLLDLVGRHHELVPGLGNAGTGLLEDLRVRPHPVHPMHADRHRHVVTVILHGLCHHRQQQLVPAAGLGHVIDIGKHALCAPLLDARPLDLRCRRRVAGDDTRFEHGHGVLATAAGDREILPGIALGLDHLLEFGRRPGLAAGGPPVQDLDVGSAGAAGRKCHSRDETRVHHLVDFAHVCVSFRGPKRAVVQSARHDAARMPRSLFCDARLPSEAAAQTRRAARPCRPRRTPVEQSL